jgi:hypothetical protein
VLFLSDEMQVWTDIVNDYCLECVEQDMRAVQDLIEPQPLRATAPQERLTAKHVAALAVAQTFRCYVCSRALNMGASGQVRFARIFKDIGHIFGNCVLVCDGCHGADVLPTLLAKPEWTGHAHNAAVECLRAALTTLPTRLYVTSPAMSPYAPLHVVEQYLALRASCSHPPDAAEESDD